MLHWPPRGQPQYAFERQKPWVTLISECLSAGPYKLSRLVLSDAEFYTSQVPTIVETYLNDRGEAFIRALEWNLGLLRTIRGVELEYDGIEPFWEALGGFKHCVVVLSGRPRHTVLQVMAQMDRSRVRFLESLKVEMSRN